MFPLFRLGENVDQRKAFLYFGFLVLLWSVFWQGSLRIIATRRTMKSETGSPAARGALIAL